MTIKRSSLFALLALVFSYFSLLGATFNGILNADLLRITVVFLTILVIAWRIIRWRQGWTWHRSRFDLVFLLWLLAIFASIALNPYTWRRSAEALWYVFFYIGVWYVLHDGLTNKRFSRHVLVNAFLLSGVPILIFAFVQVFIEMGRGFPHGVPRPVSLLGNPNTFSTYLIVLLPFAMLYLLNSSRRLNRVIMGGYTLSIMLMLGLARSRGAIIALFAMLFFLFIFTLAEKNLLFPKALWRWLKGQSNTIRYLLLASVIIALITGVVVAIALVTSLNTAGRSLELRTYLWEAAIDLFQKEPLTGNGFFTFGRYLTHYDSIPVGQPQSHAHSLVLNIAAELGAAGLLALAATVLITIAQFFKNWRTMPTPTRGIFIASAAALMGWGAHHLLDTTAMMPIIALLGLLMLLLVTTDVEAQPLQSRLVKGWYVVSITGLWLGLLILAFWHMTIYSQYITTLRAVDDDYSAAAANLQPLIDADPYQPAYVLQQAYLYGLAAADGDTEALQLAIAGYERYTRLEPTHSQGWANLAALYFQAGRRLDARATIDVALRFAPNWQHFRRQRNIYAGAMRDAEDIIPPEPPDNRDGANWARFQYLRDIIDTEYLPQVGWATRH